MQLVASLMFAIWQFVSQISDHVKFMRSMLKPVTIQSFYTEERIVT